MGMNCNQSYSAFDDDAEALFAVGRRFLTGNGVPQDRERAKYLLSQAAAMGHDIAQALLDRMKAEEASLDGNRHRHGGCQVTIVDARPEDADTIVDFQLDMAKESEGLVLARDCVEKGVRAALMDENKGRYLLAKDGHRVVGSLMLTREWSDWNAAWYWWIQSVYVVPTYRRKGVFSQMYGAVMELARQDGVHQVKLYVDKDNRTAQKTYGSLGMQESHYHLYEKGLDREATNTPTHGMENPDV